MHARESAALKKVARHTQELGNGALRIVVVADSHGSPHGSSHKHMAAAQPDLILHAGDIGDYALLDELAKLAPVLAVRGNIDGRAREIPDALTLEVTDQGAPLVRLLLLHLGVNGPRLRSEAARLARSEGATLVVCGHSHVPFIGRHGGLSIFNPGSIGPRRFPLPVVFGVITVDREHIELRHIDCETGLGWTP